MRAWKYFAAGLILGIGLTWGWFTLFPGDRGSEPALPATAAARQQAQPFAVIYDFYRALDEGREEACRSLVSPELQAALNSKPFIQQLQSLRQQDPSLRFVFFLIKEQAVDLQAGTAWARGNAEWVAQNRGTISLPQKILLLNQQGRWKIQAIEEQGGKDAHL
ncbi:hypothetical protein [Moorella sp. Hama-1]|uniref:hypothetical protein n=1 Tax=Moorella sp. Hama-1 TaxID=2138101 RepID=UPI000D640EDD|nr:hypothetical protein [Moorella sp. Hama-1]MDN5361480.1 hypothetical protein [Moorella sp. (in: firmicutes)]BCV21239.1 hypothetical protein hamaS1_13080 [Moorella sp. Hama-1]